MREACRLAGTDTSRRRDRGDGLSRFDLPFRLQHRLRHLLHEQRNAVRCDPRFPSLHPPAAPCSTSFATMRRCLTFLKPVKCDAGHIGVSSHGDLNSGRKVMTSSAGIDLIRSTNRFDHLEARRIGPMRILEDHQHRSLFCQSRYLRDQGFQCSVSALLRRKLRARDSGHHWGATTFPQRARHPQSGSRFRVNKALSLSSFAFGGSSCASPAARSIWPMMG